MWILLSHTCGKDGKTVQKLLGILALGVAFALLVSGTTGCNTPKKDDEKKADAAKADAAKATKADAAKADAAKATKADAAKGEKDAEVKIKAIEGEITLKKKDKEAAKVKVEIEEAAPTELTLKAFADKVDAKVLAGTGKIKKGEKEGEIVVITSDAPATVNELTIEVSGTKVKTATLKVKAKVAE